MPQIPANQLNPLTSFSTIYQTMGPAGGDTSHIRFTNAKGLYTSQKASASGLKDLGSGALSKLTGGRFVATDHLQQRASKQADGATRIRAAIDFQCGPGYGDRIFQQIQNQTGRNLNLGVTRVDMGLIDQAIRAEASVMPTGTRIDNNGVLSGQATIVNTLQGQPLAGKLQQAAQGYTQTTANVGNHTVAARGQADMSRMNVSYPAANRGTFLSKNQSDQAIFDNLRAFAGSDQATKALSGVLNQHLIWAALAEVPNNNGNQLFFVSPQSGQAASMMDANGNIVPIADPSTLGNTRLTVSRDANNNFKIDVDANVYFREIRDTTAGTSHPLPLHDPQHGAVRANVRTTWTVDANAAAAGNVQLQVQNPLTITYDGRLS